MKKKERLNESKGGKEKKRRGEKVGESEADGAEEEM